MVHHQQPIRTPFGKRSKISQTKQILPKERELVQVLGSVWEKTSAPVISNRSGKEASTGQLVQMYNHLITVKWSLQTGKTRTISKNYTRTQIGSHNCLVHFFFFFFWITGTGPFFFFLQKKRNLKRGSSSLINNLLWKASSSIKLGNSKCQIWKLVYLQNWWRQPLISQLMV